MPKSAFVQVFDDRAGKSGLIGFVSRLLLGWYLREVRRVEVPETPGEAIVTYPLA